MKPVKIREVAVSPTDEGARDYIAQMLEELSKIAQTSGLFELAALLRATLAASKVDITLEAES